MRKLHKKNDHTRTMFYKNLFKFVKDLFTKKKGGILKTSKQELEKHLKMVHLDKKRNGVPYKFYKNATDVLRYLWRLMRSVVKGDSTKGLAKSWRRTYS